MQPDRQPRAAGGFLLAVATVLGAGIGVAVGETSIGLIAGFVIGAIAAIAVAVWDSRRP